MDIKDTGVVCKRFLEIYNSVSEELTKHVSGVLQGRGGAGDFDLDVASETAKLWWVVNCFTNIVSDDEVFNDTELLHDRAEIISGYFDIEQEYIVEAFKKMGEMALREQEEKTDIVDEALGFIFTIYNILRPDKPIIPSTDSLDDDLVSHVMTDVQVAYANGHICKQAIEHGLL